MSAKKIQIAVIGAGISGLSFSFFLKRQRPDIQLKLFEASSQAGGWIQTGECGPHIFQEGRSSHLLSLIHDLGLSEDVQFSDEKSSHRYVLKNQKLEKIPENLFEIFSSPLTRGSLLSLLREWTKEANSNDETIYDFGLRRFGKALTENILDPLVIGIFAGSIEKLSVASCLPYLKKLESEHGSILKGLFKGQRGGKKRLFTLRGGMHTLIQSLEQKLFSELLFNHKITRLEKTPEGNFLLTAATGEMFEAEEVLIGTSLSGAIKLLNSLESGLGEKISHIPSKGVQVLHLIFQKKLRKFKGFGYLIPFRENHPVLGVIFDSDIFQDNHYDRFTVMLKEEVKNPLEEALKAFRDHLDIPEMPLNHFSVLCEKAIPQYPVGHASMMAQFFKELQEKYPALHVIGNFISGVSVNECIRLSAKHSETFLPLST